MGIEGTGSRGGGTTPEFFRAWMDRPMEERLLFGDGSPERSTDERLERIERLLEHVAGRSARAPSVLLPSEADVARYAVRRRDLS